MPSSPDDIIKKCHVGEKVKQISSGETVHFSHNHNHLGNTNLGPVHYLHELPQAAEERYAELFKQLDRKGSEHLLVLSKTKRQKKILNLISRAKKRIFFKLIKIWCFLFSFAFYTFH